MSRQRGGRNASSRGSLSEEDAALWQYATQSYEPLKGAKPRVVAGAAAGSDDDGTGRRPDASAPARPRVAAAPSPMHRRAGAAAIPPPPPPPATAPAPALSEFDRRKARKLAAGREAIDARIDLHGMRQSEAHAALRSFLLGCHADGRRNVLVITGKGGPAQDCDVERPFAMDTRERGVLRRNVPQWLAEPELRAIVVSFRDAARGHGGAGALYVHLRARAKAGRR